MSAPHVPVRHNPDESRYEALVDGYLSVCDYEMTGAKMIFTHTFVPPELRGRGVAEQLVRAALRDAHAAKRTVVPACSYVAKYIERHREYQDLLAQ